MSLPGGLLSENEFVHARNLKLVTEVLELWR